MPDVRDLSHAELRCLELAWEAYGSGTVPVGAVVTGPDGGVRYEGRSRMYDRVAPPGEIAGSLLAHAEVNALLRLSPQERHETSTITSSLEPCPLCLGAIGMATVGRLVYLGADPYGGAVGRHQPTPHLARVPLDVRGPREDEFGLLASALHVAFYLVRRPEGHVVALHRAEAPHVVRAATALLDAGAPAAAAREPLAGVLPGLLAAVAAG